VAAFAGNSSGIAGKGPIGSSHISGSCGTVLFSYSALAVLFLRCIIFRNIISENLPVGQNNLKVVS
jgi:hypothetical protein